MRRKENSKLIYLDHHPHHARLLHALHLAFKGSHRRCAQFALEHAYGLRTHVGAFKSQQRSNESMKIFLPFGEPYHKPGTRHLINLRQIADDFACHQNSTFTDILKRAIESTVWDLEQGRIPTDHDLVTKYFPRTSVNVPHIYLSQIKNNNYHRKDSALHN